MEVAEGDAQVSPALLQCDALQQCCRCSGNSSCSVVPSNCPEATAGQKGAVATQDKATKGMDSRHSNHQASACPSLAGDPCTAAMTHQVCLLAVAQI